MNHSTALVNEFNAAERLILKYFSLGIGSQMHISGLCSSKFRKITKKARFLKRAFKMYLMKIYYKWITSS